MSPAGVFLRSIVALLLGVLAFLALGYAYVAMGVRDTLRSPQPLLNALEEHHAYERVYDDGIITEQFEGELRGLVGEFSLEPETEAWLLKEILPPSELKTATEQSVKSVIAFLNNETDTFDATIDLAAAIPRIKPAVFRLVDERIDKARPIDVTSEVELRRSIETLFRAITAGTIPNSVATLDGHAPDKVIQALMQSIDVLPDMEARRTAQANLTRDERAITDALEAGLCTKLRREQGKLTGPTHYERSSHAHPARCHYTLAQAIQGDVSGQDMVEGPGAPNWGNLGDAQADGHLGAPRHGAQRRHELCPLPPRSQPCRVVTPPVGTLPAVALGTTPRSGRWATGVWDRRDPGAATWQADQGQGDISRRSALQRESFRQGVRPALGELDVAGAHTLGTSDMGIACADCPGTLGAILYQLSVTRPESG